MNLKAALPFIVGSLTGLSLIIIMLYTPTVKDFNECKTVEIVGSCTRYDCRVGFTDGTHGTLRGPALQGDLVCKFSFRNFWEMPNE